MENLAVMSQTVYESPVKGPMYERRLGSKRSIEKQKCYYFLNQWYEFSSFIPKFLSLCAWKAESEIERNNILKNLFSEMGLDSNGKSHSTLLSDLILDATGSNPSKLNVTSQTNTFISNLEGTILNSDASFNSGALQALEFVAYDILSVISEILIKSGNEILLNHDYITIHEKIEIEHINSTLECVSLHKNEQVRVDDGYAFVMKEWKIFWDSIYLNF